MNLQNEKKIEVPCVSELGLCKEIIEEPGFHKILIPNIFLTCKNVPIKPKLSSRRKNKNFTFF